MGKLLQYSPYNLGYLGFLGFLGFGYFVNNNAGLLLLFGLFGLFGCFFIGNLNKGIRFLGDSGKMLEEKQDERYVLNAAKAGCLSLAAPVVALFLIALSVIAGFASKELIVILCAAGFAATPLAYSIAFYYFEKQ